MSDKPLNDAEILKSLKDAYTSIENSRNDILKRKIRQHIEHELSKSPYNQERVSSPKKSK